MTQQNDLNRAVARATGETVSTIAAMGFMPLADIPAEPEPLVVDWDQRDGQRVSLFPSHRRREPAAA